MQHSISRRNTHAFLGSNTGAHEVSVLRNHHQTMKEGRILHSLISSRTKKSVVNIQTMIGHLRFRLLKMSTSVFNVSLTLYFSKIDMNN